MADQFLAPYPFYVAPSIQDSSRQLCELPEAPHKEERSRATVHDAVGSSHWNATGTSSLLGFNHFSNHPGHPFESSSSFSSTGDEFSDTSSFPLDGVHNLLPLDYAPIGGLSSAGLATPKAKPFILKLLYVLSHPEVYGDVLRWDGTGSCFILVQNSPRLVTEILPTVWGHANVASFTRQLGVYDFVKLDNVQLSSLIDSSHKLALPLSEYSGWSNEHFNRLDDSQMYRLRPRPTQARQQKKDEKAQRREAAKLAATSSHGGVAPEGGAESSFGKAKSGAR